MDHFSYRDGHYYAEEVPLHEVASHHGTPCFVYSRATIEHHYRIFERAFAPRRVTICYAVKANSNLAVLDVLARLGAGFDIVSVGELERVLAAGGNPGKIVFSGVGKSRAEVRRALEARIACFNVESEPELERIDAVARELGVCAPVSLRVNPDVDPGTHPYIATGLRTSKFGIGIESAPALYERAAALSNISVVGIDCHIGSQLTQLSPYVEALERLLALADALLTKGIPIRHLDLGGGLGIRYRDEEPPNPASYAQALLSRLQGYDYDLMIEPGRAIVGNAGVLLTRLEYIKHSPAKSFAIVDAGMNDLLRPALYDAWQEILPAALDSNRVPRVYDVVGPVCETGDFLGRDRQLAVVPGDLLVVRSAGAYGFSMSSNYNSRPRAAEVMVDGDQMHLVRPRENIGDLYASESILPARSARRVPPD